MEFVSTNAAGEELRYTDKKRWLWFFGLFSLFVPIFGYFLYFAFEKNVLFTAVPFLYVFLIIPVLDILVGEDPYNPPEEISNEMSKDRFYDFVIYATVPFFYLTFFATMWFICTQDLPIWSLVLLLIGTGTLSGGAINLGHELGHRTDRLNRFWAKLALGLSGYGHFAIEHNRGHHVNVSTPNDCASSRMGESVYAFACRELPGAFKGGWAHEQRRLAAKGLPAFHVQNELLQVYLWTTAITIGLCMWLGWQLLPFILIHHFFGWYGLTQVNYIEHYGLLRQQKPNGKYEPCQPHHSWNTNHIVSNLMQIHLQRHSDHHANPMRPYQALRNFPDLPRLPSGYPGCLGLAAIPPLWFKVMDPRVMKWADGDIGKVHLCPRAADKLRAKYDAQNSQISV